MPVRLNCNISHTIILKKSEFITELNRVFTLEEIHVVLKDAHKRHPKATHICTAFRIENHERSNDDGEPSGTAGLPMLEVLRKQDVIDILALVIRYYGGIQLGAGGLTRAYNSSVAEALASAQLNPLVQRVESQVCFPIQYADTILYSFNPKEVIRKQFDTDVTLTLLTQNMDFIPHLQEITRGQIEILYQIDKIIESKP